jgi:hypothetical protein
MLADFADWRDVEAVYRTLTDAEKLTAAGLLSEASAKLRVACAEAGVDLDTVIWEDELKLKIAKVAVANAAKRVIRNTEGYSETSFAIDDYRETNRRDAETSNPMVFIDPADTKGLVPRKRRIGTLRVRAAL